MLLLILLVPAILLGQTKIESIEEIQLKTIQPGTVSQFWLHLTDDGMSQPVYVPVIIAKGKTTEPVLGLTAAIHGNELNGIRIIQRVFEELDLETLEGTIIGIPGLNTISIPNHERRFIDEEDLNRNFPGKENGNRSQQYVYQINKKILSQLDYLIDMHTASFGRTNTLYVRADMENDATKTMALLQDADIILNNKGVPSADEKIAATHTMRAEAMLQGIPAITIEYGDPQVYQTDMIERGKIGVENVLSWLKMTPQKITPVGDQVICKKSYWIFLDKGGYLEVPVELNQLVKKGELIGRLRNPFGDIIQDYYCPEDGIVIGRSSNPVNMSGGRIIHLGILNN
ncbi:MAG: succinylglutamate desuccinylase/aspartoacylase family protein [Saprospiraceae bacterium]|nr:succinylglutamate desuccinylase/aspartoacylase family protein [Saprospiraceae bacterium]